jgi:hypothetical protein
VFSAGSGGRVVDRGAGLRRLHRGLGLGEVIAGQRLLVRVATGAAVVVASRAVALVGLGGEDLEVLVFEDVGAGAVGLGDVHLIGGAAVLGGVLGGGGLDLGAGVGGQGGVGRALERVAGQGGLVGVAAV